MFSKQVQTFFSYLEIIVSFNGEILQAFFFLNEIDAVVPDEGQWRSQIMLDYPNVIV